ncbi:DNA gyrase inhibitor YacG [Pseudochelatococcus sp. G4_1912]|uniref:DNA gyrase inhibitor YacG n=1 Tax=Pseudochelatococcus sp. G4_1912 TaxID=3114288 RepID=UPI0039C71E0F
MSDAVNDNDSSQSPFGKCPICAKPSEERWHPFCSRRCADVDLHRWLSGNYAIPVTEPGDDEEG